MAACCANQLATMAANLLDLKLPKFLLFSNERLGNFCKPPFEVIFDDFMAHIGRHSNHNLMNTAFQILKSLMFICINTVFRVAPQDSPTISNCRITMANFPYRADIVHVSHRW